MERLGLAALLDARGAVRTHPEVWTPHSGLISFPTDAPHGYGVTRATLDPMLRELAAATPGVELLQGVAAAGLIGDQGRIAGVELVDRDGAGRRCGPAWWSVPTAVTPRSHGWRGCAAGCVPTTASSTSPTGGACAPPRARPRLWLLDPEAAAMFPNEDDVTVLVAGFHRAQLADVRADPEGAYQRLVRALPEGPDLAGAERTSKLIGALDVPNVLRPAAKPGRRARRRCRPGRRSAVRSRLRLGLPERRVAGRPHGRRGRRRRRPRSRAGPLPPRLPPAPAPSLLAGRRLRVRAPAARRTSAWACAPPPPTRTMRARSRRSRAAAAPRCACSGRASCE